MINNILLLLLYFLCGLLWRMGGSDAYDKLWRRIGCSLYMLCGTILINKIFTYFYFCSFILLLWGCWSYMGWLNYIVRLWWKDIIMKREYWWNYFIENLVIQSSILFYKNSIKNILFIFIFAFIVTFIKIWINKDKDGQILFWRKDILSEFFHGSLNYLGIIINLYV